MTGDSWIEVVDRGRQIVKRVLRGPELDGIAFGTVEPNEAAVGVLSPDLLWSR